MSHRGCYRGLEITQKATRVSFCSIVMNFVSLVEFSVPFLPSRLWLLHINLFRLFPNFRRGTGFLSKLYTPSERGFSEIYGVVTNNHVLPSETYAKNAIVTFGYEGSGEGEKVKLKPKIMFRTEKVSTVCACDPMQISFEGFQNFVGLEGILQHATSWRLPSIGEFGSLKHGKGSPVGI